jgi:hypothetical protein
VCLLHLLFKPGLFPAELWEPFASELLFELYKHMGRARTGRLKWRHAFVSLCEELARRAVRDWPSRSAGAVEVARTVLIEVCGAAAFRQLFLELHKEAAAAVSPPSSESAASSPSANATCLLHPDAADWLLDGAASTDPVAGSAAAPAEAVPPLQALVDALEVLAGAWDGSLASAWTALPGAAKRWAALLGAHVEEADTEATTFVLSGMYTRLAKWNAEHMDMQRGRVEEAAKVEAKAIPNHPRAVERALRAFEAGFAEWWAPCLTPEFDAAVRASLRRVGALELRPEWGMLAC